MIRILKMEGFRAIKSLSTWIILPVFIGMTAFVTLIMGILLGNSEWMNWLREFVPGLELAGMDMTFDEQMQLCLQGNTTLLFVIVWMGLFVTGHHVTGYRKTLGRRTDTLLLGLADAVYSFLYSCLLLLTGIPVIWCVMHLTASQVITEDICRIFRFAVTYALMNMEISSLCTLISGCFRNRIAAIAAPMVYCIAGGNVLYYLFENLTIPVLGVPASRIAALLPYGAMSYQYPDGFLIPSVSAILLTFLFTFLGTLQDEKKEIR